jgi:hypothetical protein
MYSASDLVEWWEENHKASEEALYDFVDEHPDWWVVGALTATAMDVGGMFVDVLRFGEGAAESYETGSIGPLIQDIFRGLSIALPLARGGQAVRPWIGRLIGLYVDTGGNTCATLAVGNSLRATGQRFLVSLDEIAAAHGKTLRVIEEYGTTNEETFRALEQLGVRFRDLGQTGSISNLMQAARQGDGVVMMRLVNSAAPQELGHIVLLENTEAGIQIIDRTGFYKSLSDLSRRYAGVLDGGKFVVDTGFDAKLILNVTAKYLEGFPMLMAIANTAVGLTRNKSVAELDAEFQRFKARQGETNPPPQGEGTGATVTVVPGDTLSGLAKTHYGTFEYWPLLWDANRSAVGPNPNRLRPGISLRIPPLSSFNPEQLADARRRFPTWRDYH